MNSDDSPQSTTPAVIGLCGLAWFSSYLLPFYTFPLSVFPSLWLAVLVWGLVLSGAGSKLALPSLGRQGMALWLPAAVLLVLALLALRWRPEESLVLLAAAAVMVFGASESDGRWLRALLAALLLAGIASAIIGGVQVLLPGHELPGIAPLAAAGRATANLRQPNQFASLLLLALVAALALCGKERGGGWVGLMAAAVLLGAGLAFSQSRTGLLGLSLIAIWAAFDRRLPASARWLPGAAVLGCLAGFGLVSLNAHLGRGDFYLEQRAALSHDISSSRFAIWSNTVELIRAFPLTGVGWGNFGHAWMLTPFPDRPVAFFHHAHNLPLHLMTELGVPLAVAVLGVFGWVLWRARGSWSGGDEEEVRVARCLWMMLLLLGVHSLLEYPLWFTYFLMPAAYFLGVLIRRGALAPLDGAPPRQPASWTAGLVKLWGVLIVVGAFYAAWDYSRVMQAFRPFGPGLYKSLEQRVAEGRKSVLFGHWVDYGVVTNLESWKDMEPAFARALHHNINAHLLMVYAQALHERGEEEKARYVAERLREFRHPVSSEFFEACEGGASVEALPFQCLPPRKGFNHRDFD